MGLGPTLILVNFEGDLDCHLDIKKLDFSIYLFITYLGRGMHSFSALVLIFVITKYSLSVILSGQ